MRSLSLALCGAVCFLGLSLLACSDSSESTATNPQSNGGSGGSATNGGSAGSNTSGSAGQSGNSGSQNTGGSSGSSGSAGSAGTGASSGGSSGSAGTGGSAGPTPGEDATVTPFDASPIYFTGDDNKREIDSTVTFPSDGAYQSIILHLALDCPSGGCDPWDRFGSLGIVSQVGQNGEPDTVVEVARFITPYHVKASWDIDVTELRPLFTGEITFRAFIDTWVGPGSPYGDGWLLSASFEMKGGIPEKLPVAVVPVWNRQYVIYGDPAKPIGDTVTPQDLTLPAMTTSYSLRTFITGHGQGNAGNCAEFCKKTHSLTVNENLHEQLIWRDDCATTAAPNQQGTYTYSRAGWCPGADVLPWQMDITSDVASQTSVSISYKVQDYENTCRPDASPCAGCTLGTGCDYDGGNHTEPNYQVSTLLIAFQ